jgi:hypothetical protein
LSSNEHSTGNQRQRDDERRDHADDRRDGDGREELALDAAQSEQRQEHQDDEHGGVEDGVSHFAGCASDDLQPGPGGTGVLAQAAEDVLHVHDRIIHHHADGDREPAERHAVHLRSEPLEVSIVIAKLIGIAMSVMNVVRKFSRNRNST